MNRVGSAVRLMLCLPPVWFALAALGAIFVFNGWEPMVDIVLYAAQRLFGG